MTATVQALRPAATATPSLLRDYTTFLARSPLAERSRDAYLERVGAFLGWLERSDEHGGAALSDPVAREHALRDYLRHLRVHLGRKPATVNGHLAAANNFFIWRGLGPSSCKVVAQPRQAPKALDELGVRRLLRAAERRGSVRDTAIVMLLLSTGLRLSELVALDVEDVALSARKGHAVVRDGKGGKYRVVALNSQAREAVQAWLDARPPAATPALFLVAGGSRVSARTVDAVVRGLGAQAGLAISPHVLRHTAATRLVRDGVDLVLVAALLGHGSLETTRIYAAPSEADTLAAVERLVVQL